MLLWLRKTCVPGAIVKGAVSNGVQNAAVLGSLPGPERVSPFTLTRAPGAKKDAVPAASAAAAAAASAK